MSSLPIAYQRHPLVATAFPRRWLTRHAGRSRTPTALFGFRLATLSFLAYLFCTCFVSSNTVPPASPLRLFLGRHPRSSQPSAFTSSFPPPPPLLTIPSCSIRTNRVPRRPCVALATLDPFHTARICCSRSGTANRASVKVVKLHDWGLGSENRTRVFVQVTGTAVWLGRRKDVSESLIEMERLAGDDLAYRMNFAIPVWRWEDPALSLFIEERFEYESSSVSDSSPQEEQSVALKPLLSQRWILPDAFCDCASAVHFSPRLRLHVQARLSDLPAPLLSSVTRKPSRASIAPSK